MPTTKTRPEAWQAVHRIADAHVRRFTGPFIASIEQLRARLPLDLVEESVVNGTMSRALADAIDNIVVAKQADPSEQASRVYAEILVSSADNAGVAFGYSFNITNPQVLRAAQTLTADLIRGVSQETKMAVRRIIFDSIRDGVAPRDAAKLIRRVVGLTTRQSAAVINLRKGLLSGGADLDFAERQAERYSKRLLKDRALTIARTETLKAANRGQQLAWTEARDKGIIPPDFGQRWVVTPDDRLCPRCAPMNGKVVQLGYLFRETQRGVLPSQREPVAGATVSSPPLHPRCRCVLVFADDLT